ncbi:MAG TPA: rhomboid family intramembrane serine protease [Longimicrobiales bacterium]|nr:rhomboid family intramembrane serine protease [Longimicrobiales bacterium]
MAYRGGFGFGGMLTPWVKRLLIANAAVFLLTALLPIVAAYLALVPRAVILRPWTPFTYMFVHGGFMHLLINMIMLFFFGPPIEGRLGSDAFIRFYLACGLGGALLSFGFAFTHPVVGASAAVIGIMVAFALYWPDAKIWIWGIFPVPAKVLVTILVVLDLYGAINASRGSPIAHFAHLGGAAVALLYVKWWQPRHLNEWKSRASGKPKSGGGGLGGLRRRMGRRNFTIASGGAADKPQGRPQPRAPRPDEERLLDEVDRVLDKISKQGIASLSESERKLLDDVSRRYRSN